jgi:hypothetical protein
LSPESENEDPVTVLRLVCHSATQPSTVKTGCVANPYWDGKVDEAVKFGDPFDPLTVEGRKRAAQLSGPRQARQAEVEALRAEERSWSFWGVILRRFWPG